MDVHHRQHGVRVRECFTYWTYGSQVKRQFFTQEEYEVRSTEFIVVVVYVSGYDLVF